MRKTTGIFKVEDAPLAKILLVDDRPSNLLALEAILEDLGQELVRANSGDEALQLLSEHDFAVILLDVQMPGRDGFEVARLIRARERSKNTPIIFVTAHESTYFSVEQAFALGAVDYLVKPLMPVVVRSKVATFVVLFREKEATRRQAEQLRVLIQGTTDYAIFMLDPQGNVVTWNAGAERVKGYRAEEIIGSHFSRFYPQSEIDRGWPAEELRRATTEGRMEDEGWRVRRDGSQFWANIVLTALRDETGRLLGFSKVTRDLTERKRNEESLKRLTQNLEVRVQERTADLAASNQALQTEMAVRKRAEQARRETEQQFRTLADSIPQLAWMARPDGRVFWFNQRWYEYTGLTPGAMRDTDWDVVHDAAHLPRVRESWERALAAGAAWEETFPLRRHDGQMRWHLTRALPVRNEQKALICWVGTNTDITDRIDVEAALKETDRRKDEFLAMLAHELRNPLAPVLNGLHILQMSASDKRIIEQARSMMERQIHHLTRLVDDLLDVSRITRGRVQVRRDRLDLTDLVRTAAEDRRSTIESAGLNLIVKVPEEPVWILGDATRLSQVLNNLLDNAVKFRNGGSNISIHMTVDAGRGQAAIEVSDEGIGFGPELFPRLFDPFAQADRSLDRSRGGLGLGLSLVKGLVELHGGEVQASSGGPGQGAVFTVRLPLKTEQEALTGLPEPAAGTMASPSRILVIEDNRDAADSLQMLLELLGHEVKVAYNGPDGVTTARAWRPEIVLCDIGLPGLDGYGVAAELRHDPATSKTLLIAITGYGLEDDRQRARQAGFDYHLTKPVDPSVLQPLLVRA